MHAGEGNMPRRMPILGGDRLPEQAAAQQLVDPWNDGVPLMAGERATRHEIGLDVDQDKRGLVVHREIPQRIGGIMQAITSGTSMHYDQSWMGYGLVGGLEAGGISAGAAILLYLIVYAIGHRQGWTPLRMIAIAFLVSLLLTASGDMWDLIYFNYARMDSIQYLKVRLAEVHDPDNIGLRVFWELIGALVGACLGWLLRGGDWRAALRGD
jgi:hypothetical protein